VVAGLKGNPTFIGRIFKSLFFLRKKFKKEAIELCSYALKTDYFS